jgi:hypothetical protein
MPGLPGARFSFVRASTPRRLAALAALLALGVFTSEPLVADVCDADGRGATWTLTPQAPAPGNAAPQHAVHVCHCAHGHAGSVASAQDAVAAPAVTASIAAPAPAAVRGPVSPPRLRPPIA